MDDRVWVPTVFTKNRDRLLEAEVARKFLAVLLAHVSRMLAGPITVGEPTDAASLAIDQKHMEDYASSDLKPGVVECRPYLRYGCRHTRPQPWHFTIPSTAHPRPDVRALFGAQRVAGTHPDQGCAPRPHHLHLGMVADSIRTAGRRTDVSEFSDARKRVRIIALGIRACRRPADHRLCP